MLSSNITPVLPVHDEAYIGGPDAESTCDFGLRHAALVKAANLNDVSLCEFGRAEESSSLTCLRADDRGCAIDMHPVLMAHDATDRWLRNAVQGGQVSLGDAPRVSAANLQNVFGRQPGAALAFSNRPPVAALRIHVRHVVRVGPKEQMRRVHARADVAAVQHASAVVAAPFGNGTVREFPGNPMRLVRPVRVVKDAVTASVFAGVPQPALAGAALVDLGPEPGDVFGFHAKHRTTRDERKQGIQ